MLDFTTIAENPLLARLILERRLQEAEGSAAQAVQHYMLWEVCQVCGDEVAALCHLEAAMTLDPVQWHAGTAEAGARRLVVLNAPGSFQANAPVAMLLDENTEIETVWVSGRAEDREKLIATVRDLKPDAVLIAIAEDDRQAAVIRQAEEIATACGIAVFNGGGWISRVARSMTAELLAGVPHVLVPECTVGRAPFEDVPPFPLLIRPVSSHAGNGLQRLNDRAALEAYVREVGEDGTYYVTRFVNYAGEDGLYRKYRVVFVDGVAYPVHLAIHNDWAVWYYNAKMEEHPERRMEEAQFMQNMAGYFPSSVMSALDGIAKAVGLDYFGLDFGVLADGTLVVFEIETGMIVHDRDPADIYPYKSACITKIRKAFEAMVDQKSGMPACRNGPDQN
ncbi:ATP-grasp domain-containing protein [Acetobacter oeni]|uniref:ATP-grasp domain-containing protein n=1 Tax=Acetobacter oeni TaxID=304077 RepID=A0A511XGW7_9PROT|nr:hypothetical protein [Acetobacter oeni]MBB3882327.1 glutathione synthase/RimK-type ligase-like ATP-grasp enzyme [Acetobacter oeni]NHO18568.1 hypothetical protein [Acetobacter oeni]GBR02232.1 hypothetical protein AA21952_0679 [Acetobacter oeni LMG 21952]GEN62190.1 hypothetical protein AOE01nite_04140 [Acetobacter oeni]